MVERGDGNDRRERVPVKVVDILSEEAIADWMAWLATLPDAVPTALATWNDVCRDDGAGIGLAKSWYVIIAGGSGQGKTMLAMNLVAAAIQQQEQVLYLSLEMTKRQLQNRIAAILTRTPIRALEKGETHDAERVIQAGRALLYADTSPLWTNPDPENALARLVDTMLEYRERGCRYFVLDYLQLIRGAKNERDLYDRVTEVSMTLRRFASSKGAIILALSQLNRQATSQRVESPMIHQLAGGSPLENDSDQVVILDHTRYERTGEKARTWLIVGKNRHGPQGEVPIEWDYRYLTVREALPDELDEWPDHKKR